MEVVKVLVIVAAIVFVLACNLIEAYKHTSAEMREKLIDNQCLVGKIAANIFYAPAWLLKALRVLIVWGVA